MQNTGRIAYVLDCPPRSKTSLACELLELERRGFTVAAFALRPDDVETKEEPLRTQRVRVAPLPQNPLREPLRIALAHLAVWRKFRAAYREELLATLRTRPVRSLLARLHRLTQACCLVREGDGAAHFHARGASMPAELAEIAGRIAGVPWSLAVVPADLRPGEIDSPPVRERLGRARFVVTDSRSSAERLRGAVNGAAPACIRWIYGGIDLGRRRSRGADPEEPLIVAVGDFVEKKGFADLIQACQILRTRGERFRCEILGVGPLRPALAQLVRKLRIHPTVTLGGAPSRRELLDAYARATVFVHPGRVDRDGDRDVLPDEIKEAMAFGVPVVASSLPGIEELVTPGTSGVLHPPGDVERLADALGLVLRDRNLRDRLVAGARSVMESRFDRRTSYDALGELFRADEADRAVGSVDRRRTASVRDMWTPLPLGTVDFRKQPGSRSP